MAEHQHRYKFGAPGGGWPTFDKDGKIVRPESVPPESVPPETEVEDLMAKLEDSLVSLKDRPSS